MLLELTVVYPNGRKEAITLREQTIGIGRSSDNDLMLVDDRISRHHAQITNRADELSIIDANSANGIVVDGYQPPAGQPVLLQIGAAIEIGAFQLIIVRQVDEQSVVSGTNPLPVSPADPAATKPETPQPAPQATPPEAAPPEAAPPEAAPPEPIHIEPPAVPPELIGTLALKLSATDLVIEPGKPNTFSVTVQNYSNRAPEVGVLIEGIPPDWYRITTDISGRSTLVLYTTSGNEGTFRVTILVPKAPSSHADLYTCQFVAYAVAEERLRASSTTTIEVLPFVAYVPSIKPKKVRGRLRARYTLAIENQSNTPLDLAITGRDDEDVIDFDLEDSVSLDAGERVALPVRAQPHGRWPFGRPVEYQVEHSVAATNHTDVPPKPVAATLILKRFSYWLVALPLLLLLALLPYLYAPNLLDLLRPNDTRQISKLEYSPITTSVSVTGSIVPANLATLTFQRDGVIETLPSLRAGMSVTRGMLLGELRSLEQLRAVRAAEDTYDRTQRELENARAGIQRNAQLSQLEVDQAQEDAAQVAPGGDADPMRLLQQDLVEAQRAQNTTANSVSEVKTKAEATLAAAAAALQAAQEQYSQASWAHTWVERYGTDPAVSSTTETTTDISQPTPVATEKKTTNPPKLNAVQKQAFKDAVTAAERNMQAAERGVNEAKRTLDTALADEVVAVQRAMETTGEVQRKVDRMVDGQNNPALSAANRNLKAAQIRLENVDAASLEPQIKAVDDARRALEIERAKLRLGQIVAPADGVIVDVLKLTGDTVTTQNPIMTLALALDNAPPLEVAATLSDEQIEQLGVRAGTPVTLTLLTSQPMTITGKVRQLPVVGSSTQPADATTRFTISDPQFLTPAQMAQALHAGTAARVDFAPGTQQNTYWLPPPFVRSDGEQSYIVQRDDARVFGWADVRRGRSFRDQRIDVQIGRRTATQVEILKIFSGGALEQMRDKTIVGPDIEQP